MIEWTVEWGGLKFTGAIDGRISGDRFSHLAKGPIMEAVDAYRNQSVVKFQDARGLTFGPDGSWTSPHMQAEIQKYPEGVCQWVVGTPTLAIWGSAKNHVEAFRKVCYWHDHRNDLIHRLHTIEKGLLV